MHHSDVDDEPSLSRTVHVAGDKVESSGRRRAFLAVCFFGLSAGASAIPLPYLPQMKSDFVESALVMDSIVAGMNLLLSVPYGRLLERNGRRSFFLAASVANSSALASLVLFPKTPIVFMLASRAAALVQASYAHCYMVDLSADPKVRARYLGYINVASLVGMFFVIPAALYPAEKDPFPIFVLGFVVALGTIALAWFGIAESPRQPQLSSTQQESCNPFAGLALLFEARSWGMATAVSILVFASSGLSLFSLGVFEPTTAESQLFLLETVVLTIVVFVVVMPRLLRSLTLSQLFVLSAAASAGLPAVLMVHPSGWPLFVLVAPLTCCSFIVFPLAQQIVSEGDSFTLGRRLTAFEALLMAMQMAGLVAGSFGLVPTSVKGSALYLVGLVIGCAATYIAHRLHQITGRVSIGATATTAL